LENVYIGTLLENDYVGTILENDYVGTYWRMVTLELIGE
jgi:hypothetical protein